MNSNTLVNSVINNPKFKNFGRFIFPSGFISANTNNENK